MINSENVIELVVKKLTKYKELFERYSNIRDDKIVSDCFLEGFYSLIKKDIESVKKINEYQNNSKYDIQEKLRYYVVGYTYDGYNPQTARYSIELGFSSTYLEKLHELCGEEVKFIKDFKTENEAKRYLESLKPVHTVIKDKICDIDVEVKEHTETIKNVTKSKSKSKKDHKKNHSKTKKSIMELENIIEKSKSNITEKTETDK